MSGRKFANCGDNDDDFPAKDLLRMLQAAGYASAVSVENIPSKDWAEKAMVSAEYLKKLIEER